MLPQQFCPDGKTYIAPATRRVSQIFQELWQYESADGKRPAFEQKLLSLQLFYQLLYSQADTSPTPCTFYTKSQAAIAKKAEAILTGDLQKHYPVRELSARFGISETSLKNYFRGIYGQNISDYMREQRMKQASRLLASTSESVNRISEQVGYLNQSKFAAVFKKQYGLSPLEYRRHYYVSTAENKNSN